MLAGFKEFIARGNAVDLAVGLVMGTAFTAIVTALVDHVINPLIAGLVGQPDFTDIWHVTVGEATMLPGAVLTAIIQFLLVAAAIYFLVVMPLNKLAERRKAGEEEAPEAPAEDVLVLQEIRDLLAAQSGRGQQS
ncbi:large conductance mechanosensitive channel protein MscL [Georgenia deserti]|uniref:Large-conductance mechanosensitive channel n=1 Tax=Georgenia deserti TaxID=2093781 RepID=A0ABW4L0U4_9MICO